MASPQLAIVSGSLKGLKLGTPSGLETRPTLVRIRSAVMDSLGPQLAGAAFLDLFAGSGANGLEAWSRGAAKVVWVEESSHALKALRRNLQAARQRQPELNGQLQAGDFRDFLRRSPGPVFKIIWLDPPFSLWPELAADYSEALSRMLAPEGRLIAEMPRSSEEQVMAQLTSDNHLSPLKRQSAGKVVAWQLTTGGES